MSESLSPSVEVLLEHAGWIKSLAERLVRDPKVARRGVKLVPGETTTIRW